MPDTRRFGRTNWLELDYATPQIVNRISVRSTQPSPGSGFVTLLGITGTNLAKIAMSSGVVHPGSPSSLPGGPGWATEFSFPATAEPVKKVRLNFEKDAAFEHRH